MTEHGRQEPGEPYRRVAVDEAAEMQRQGALVVDVRTHGELGQGHVKGALHIPVDDVLMEADANLPQNKDLLLVCAAGVRLRRGSRAPGSAGAVRWRLLATAAGGCCSAFDRCCSAAGGYVPLGGRSGNFSPNDALIGGI